MERSAIPLLIRKLEARKGDCVLLGGAAMLMHGVDRETGDLDCYATGASEEGESFLMDGEVVDVTGSQFLWGRIQMPDIAKEGSCLVDGVRVATPETLFILKADAARDKDVEDLAALSGLASPTAIAQRLHALARHNSRREMFFIVENVIGEVVLNWPGMTYGDMLALCDFEPGLFKPLAESLAPELLRAGAKNKAGVHAFG